MSDGGSYKLVPLTKGYFAKVSPEDYERVSALKWTASIESRGTKVYAIRWQTVAPKKRVKVRMHHFVLGIAPGTLPPGTVVDHVEHDSLDNRRDKLEIVTQDENMRRSQGWKKKPVDPFL